MPGKSLNEWNCTQEGDFSLADELTGKQRCESLQTNPGKVKYEVENKNRHNTLVKCQK
jgi:hypothetical protein